MQSITDAFAQFIKQQRIKNDVIISKKQAINGDVVELDKVINDICAKYHAS
jgi:predicted transcriptional regulator